MEESNSGQPYNRHDHLKSLYNSRRKTTRDKVDAAILRLIKAKAYVNFNSVAKVSGLSKATLYNNSDIRKTIEDLRNKQSQTSSPVQLKWQMTEESKDAVIASLKRKISVLTDENNKLKEQLKRNYAKYYENL